MSFSFNSRWLLSFTLSILALSPRVARSEESYYVMVFGLAGRSREIRERRTRLPRSQAADDRDLENCAFENAHD